MSVDYLTQERRSESYRQLNTLVATRTNTLALFTKLASVKPFKPDQPTQTLLQEFCESLIDYTATAHFQLYRYIDEKKERRQPILNVAGEIYPRIIDITQKVLDFNDKYDCEDHCENLQGLANDLSELGVLLADRIELEDRLISVLTAEKR